MKQNLSEKKQSKDILENKQPIEKRLFSAEELSEYLGIPRGTIYNWVSQGKLPYVKLRGILKFDKADIDKIIENSKMDSVI